MIQRGHGQLRAESGVALLSALLTVALLTVIVIEMTDATLVHSHLTRNAGNAMAAQLLARSAAIAGEALVSDETTNPAKVTCDKNLWAAPFLGIPAGAGMVALQITDEGGKLDLNSVGDTNYRAAVEKLFDTLGLEQSLVGLIANWIKPATDGSMATGAASDYCALSMPCAPRQLPLNSLEELLLIRGFDRQSIARLRPFVTVIPPANGRSSAPNPVNALTAKPQVLLALGCEGGDQVPACPTSFGGSDDEKTKDWQKEYADWQTKNCKPGAKNLLSTSSTTFAIDAHGVVGDMEQGLRVLVRRGKVVQRLTWQERPPSDTLPTEVR